MPSTATKKPGIAGLFFIHFRPLHNSLNRNRFKGKIMQQSKVLQRPLRVFSHARRCSLSRWRPCAFRRGRPSSARQAGRRVRAPGRR
ncbi:hypothetical protein E0H33_14200 [Rhizobium leguminosarum bv. viciae]|nr:hypothetical protein [Rhizobium leguminosarum bv. viciae]TBZ14491.1 hypothetical protein E0H33_14200 [Rhizobium leguminosarum bv. viciae]